MNTTIPEAIAADGIIELDTERGAAIGFLSSDFGAGSYLWRMGDVVCVSFIESLRRGAFKELCQRLLTMGMTVHISTPLGRMQRIVRKAGYVQRFIYSEDFGDMVEVWEMKPSGLNRKAVTSNGNDGQAR